MFPEQQVMTVVLLMIFGGVCGLLPRYMAKKLRIPEVGGLSVFVCAFAGYALGIAGLVSVVLVLALSFWWLHVRILSPEEVGATGLQASERHHILAGFFDLHVAGALFPPFLILCIMISPTMVMLAVGSIAWICLVFYLFLYPRFPSFRTPFCTPGEAMAGCALEQGVKVWYTPFTQSRWLLFLLLWILLLYPSNAFDSIIQQAVQGEAPSLLVVLGRTVYVVIFLVSIYHLSQARFGWAIVPYVLLSIQVLASPFIVDRQLVLVVKGINLVLMSMLTIMVAFYSHARTQERRLWPKLFQPCMGTIAAGILVVALWVASHDFLVAYWNSFVVSPQWEEYTSPEGDFRVSLPNTPSVDPEHKDGDRSSFSVKTPFNRGEFGVWRFTYSERIEAIGEREEILQWFASQFADTAQAEAPVRLHGQKGVRVLTFYPDGFFWKWQQRWIFYKDRRIYMLVIRGNSPAEIAIHAGKFVRSFQLR